MKNQKARNFAIVAVTAMLLAATALQLQQQNSHSHTVEIRQHHRPMLVEMVKSQPM